MTRKAELYASLQPPAWYGVCAQREYRARDQLLEIGIGEVWLPECRVIVTRRRARTKIDGPLFPGYLFVRGVLTDEWLAAVLSVGDVHDLLRMGATPVPACERQIMTLRQLMVQTGDRILIEAGRVKRGFNHIHETAFKPRQQIRVLDGPFAGFDGLFMAAAGEDRIKIMLDIFGRNTSLEIDEASVEAVA